MGKFISILGTVFAQSNHVWSGDDYVGQWTATGGNRPHPDSYKDVRDYINMFDGNNETYWHGYLPVTEQNSVKVTFKEEVNFDELIFYVRPDKVFDQNRYRNVCLYLDEAKTVCTGQEWRQPGQQITLKLDEKVLATIVELRFPVNSSAVVAQLEIHYTFSEGEMAEDFLGGLLEGLSAKF